MPVAAISTGFSATGWGPVACAGRRHGSLGANCREGARGLGARSRATSHGAGRRSKIPDEVRDRKLRTKTGRASRRGRGAWRGGAYDKDPPDATHYTDYVPDCREPREDGTRASEQVKEKIRHGVVFLLTDGGRISVRPAAMHQRRDLRHIPLDPCHRVESGRPLQGGTFPSEDR